jgi:hypothetical protein
MKFKEIFEEECSSDSAPAESTFTDTDNAKGSGDRIGSKKKQKTKMFRKEKINWNE